MLRFAISQRKKAVGTTDEEAKVLDILKRREREEREKDRWVDGWVGGFSLPSRQLAFAKGSNYSIYGVSLEKRGAGVLVGWTFWGSVTLSFVPVLALVAVKSPKRGRSVRCNISRLHEAVLGVSNCTVERSSFINRECPLLRAPFLFRATLF